ncbi:efflux transporter outer membrane subunit [Cupriavidus numazuensis]|nr:efflux transporter outer membrane subunit [Cupriavidus numazuensis]
MKRLCKISLGAAMCSLSACMTVGPDYHVPDKALINLPKAQAAFVDTDGAKGVDAGHTVPDDWWKLYDDPLLSQLIGQALATNAGLRTANANLSRANAIYDQAKHAGGFGYHAVAAVQRAQLSAETFLLSKKLPVVNLADAALSASYEVDLFGKFRRSAEAALADTQASEAALDLARMQVVAEVARTYMDNCHATHELSIAQRSLDLQLRVANLTQRLHSTGRGAPTDLSRAKAQADLLRARLPLLRARKKNAQYALSTLLGHTPGDLPSGVDHCEEAPVLGRPIPLGDGMALLQRRPDVRAAERRLAGATARIGVATAELYPDVKLGASVGAAGLLDDFGKAPTREWSFGPLISWTFPTRGAQARLRATEAGADAALAQFDQTVLNALRDTQTALNNYAQRLEHQAALRAALEEARIAATQNRALYRGGRVPYLTSLDADRTLASAEAAVADTDAQISLDQINLFLALGGSWK